MHRVCRLSFVLLSLVFIMGTPLGLAQSVPDPLTQSGQQIETNTPHAAPVTTKNKKSRDLQKKQTQKPSHETQLPNQPTMILQPGLQQLAPIQQQVVPMQPMPQMVPVQPQAPLSPSAPGQVVNQPLIPAPGGYYYQQSPVQQPWYFQPKDPRVPLTPVPQSPGFLLTPANPVQVAPGGEHAPGLGQENPLPPSSEQIIQPQLSQAKTASVSSNEFASQNAAVEFNIGYSSFDFTTANLLSGLDVNPEMAALNYEITAYLPKTQQNQWANWIGLQLSATEYTQATIHLKKPSVDEINKADLTGYERSAGLCFSPSLTRFEAKAGFCLAPYVEAREQVKFYEDDIGRSSESRLTARGSEIDLFFEGFLSDSLSCGARLSSTLGNQTLKLEETSSTNAGANDVSGSGSLTRVNGFARVHQKLRIDNNLWDIGGQVEATYRNEKKSVEGIEEKKTELSYTGWQNAFKIFIAYQY